MKLHLGGHLSWYDPQKRTWLDIDLPHPTSLAEILDRMGIPEAEVALTVLNGELVPLEQALVTADDRLELFPPMGGG